MRGVKQRRKDVEEGTECERKVIRVAECKKGPKEDAECGGSGEQRMNKR
jgi:hypothetical protein